LKEGSKTNNNYEYNKIQKNNLDKTILKTNCDIFSITCRQNKFLRNTRSKDKNFLRNLNEKDNININKNMFVL
jgi:hypothetical protein